MTDNGHGQCKPFAKDGDSCVASSPYEPLIQCAGDLFCSFETKTCQKRIALGQNGCEELRENCAAGSRCVGGTCVAPGKLEETCQSRGDVETCEAGLICPEDPPGQSGIDNIPTGKCVAKGVKRTGESCLSPAECIEGGCEVGKCTAAVPEGGACDFSKTNCVATARCVQGTCRSLTCSSGG